MEFSKEGLLEPGLHKMSIEDFENTFVKEFNTSQTRRKIYDSFIVWKEQLVQKFKIHEIWIDGSFVTKKINPNDVDIVVFVHAIDFNNLAKEWNLISSSDNIDAYMTLAVCEESEKTIEAQVYWQFVNHRNYWRGQFGFDRNDYPKGIVVLNCDQQKNLADKGGDL